MTCLPDTVRQNSKLISIFAELSAKKHSIMQTVERMAEPEMREAMQRPDAGTIPKGASKTVKGTVIYHSPVGDIQLDWEDGAVTALKNAGADAKAGAPNELTELVFRQLDDEVDFMILFRRYILLEDWPDIAVIVRISRSQMFQRHSAAIKRLEIKSPD